MTPQHHSTDNVGPTESTPLLAFKVDGQADGERRQAGRRIRVQGGKVLNASYKCADNQSGMDSCVGTVANGSPVDTSTVGPHAFTVTGTDKARNLTTKTVHYTVVYTCVRDSSARSGTRRIHP